MTGNRNSFGGKPVKGIAKNGNDSVHGRSVPGTLFFNRVRQVAKRIANIRFNSSQASPLRGCDDPFYLRKTYKSLKIKEYSEYYKKTKIMFDKIENI